MPDSQASEHALDYVEKTVAGQAVRFSKLTVRDREKLLQSAKKAARDELARDIQDAQLPADQKYVELRTHDTGVWGLGRWVQLANSYEGQTQIYAASLRRSKYSDDQINQILDDLSLPQQEEMELICALANLPLVAPAPPGTKQIGIINGEPVYIAVDAKDGGEGDEPSPTQAATAPQTQTPRSYGK